VEFLPRALHQPMQLLLAEWMYLPWQEANRAAAAARGATQGGSQAVLDTRQAEQIQVGAGCTAVVTRVSGLPAGLIRDCCGAGGTVLRPCGGRQGMRMQVFADAPAH
jgi:hypothetical protein